MAGIVSEETNKNFIKENSGFLIFSFLGLKSLIGIKLLF